MVSAWSSHDQDDSNQETPYRPVRCLTNTRHCAFLLKAIHQSHRAACWLPAACCLLPAVCLALGLWLGPPSALRANQIVLPGGPYQYYSVRQYSVVRRAWGPGGVAIFLNRSASTPPRIIIGVFLIPPVRCSLWPSSAL